MSSTKNTSQENGGAVAAAEGAPLAQPCLVVGIGASAGGQAALEQLFAAFPPDCDLSFVVIMHIPPDGPSFLAEMLNRYTPMAVVTAEEGMRLQSNRVHVIPAGKELTIDGGLLRLDEPAKSRGAKHPIDCFFHALAADAKERAIAIVLSGAGTDGTQGVKEVKKAGGVVIVQEPASAVNPNMPRSAIATGTADFVLPAEEIPAKIAEIARGACALAPHTCEVTTIDEELAALFAAVKAQTGHDFSSYKANTVMRRIERRMAVNDVAGIKKYAALLAASPQEAHALSQDILIGVTSFFRDPEAFETLRRVIIPRLFADRNTDEPVRIWHACCATGEEVYSMAFLVREYLDEHHLDAKVQFFATDLDEASIAQARAGLYPDGIEAEVGEERLKTFFTRVDGGRWQVVKPVREMVVFAHHSLIKNPPFSRLDLLVCRNFLIYLNPDMQKRLISLFHQVLKPGGFLFLGSSETVGRHSDLFAPVDKKWKTFQRLETGRRGDTLFPFTTPIRYVPGTGRLLRSAEAAETAPGAAAEKLLLERHAPPFVVVNEKYEVVHVSARTGRFLEVPAGEPTRDLLRMAREELRPPLRAAVYKCFNEQREIEFRGVKVSVAGEETTVNVRVAPLGAPLSTGPMAMVVFEPAPLPTLPAALVGGEEAVTGDDASREMLIHQLEEQLRITHEQLQAVTEQLETSNEGFLSANEELISMNEEFQSANEELQSTNEELETSKEELQALNEELVTVNAELHEKVVELDQTNSDMENLFTSSEIATLFLDRKLTIKRFTPAAAAIFNLIPADYGRPFRHLAGKIDWPTFSHDAETVLAGRPCVEQEVATLSGERCYLKRIFPYRNPEGGIDGIVVTFIDITERKQADEALRESEERLRAFVTATSDVVYSMSPDWNEMRHLEGQEFIADTTDPTRNWQEKYIHPDDQPLVMATIHEAIRTRSIFELEHRVIRVDGTLGWTFSRAIPIVDATGEIIQWFGAARDITERKQAEEALRRSKEEWERTFDSVPDLIAIMDDRHRIVRANRAMADRLGVTAEECVGKACYLAVHGADQPPGSCPHALTLADGRGHATELHEERLGGDFLVSTTPLLDEQGRMVGSVHVARDITERKLIEEKLHQQNALLNGINRIFRETLTACTDEELGETCLAVAEEITGSRFGFISEIGPDGLLHDIAISNPGWELCAMYDRAGNRRPPGDFHVHGVYGRVILDGKGFFTNSPASYPDSIGTPEGHPPLTAFLGVPLLSDGRAIGMIAVANREGGYGQGQLEVLETLALAIVETIKRKRSEEALRETEERVRRKLEAVISPEGDIGALALADIIDAGAVQTMMEDFYKLSHTPVGVVDLEGKVLVGVGWQDICTKFHRVHPETCRNCLESDLQLSAGVPQGEFKLYKCRNNLWDAATPIMVGDRHFGNFFIGQFFFEDEQPDYELFRAQARQNGFDEKEYLTALDRVPRLSKESLASGMTYFMKFADMLSKLSYGNLKLARSLAERETLTKSLRRAHDELELRVADRTKELASAVDGLQEEVVEREKAEGALRASEQKYRSLFEESKDVIYIASADGRALDVNPAGTELFGYTKEEFCAPDFAWDLYCDPADRERFLGELKARGYVRDHEVCMRRKNREPIHVLKTATVIRDEQGEITGYRGIIHDITKRKQLEQQLLQAQKMESIGILAGGVAHDFNNMLTAISGYSQIIQEQYAGKDEMLDACVEQVMGATNRAVELTRNLLAFSRKQIINPQPLRVNDIVTNLSKLLTRIIGEDIDLGTQLDSWELTVMADSGQIDQVLVNLATNARDAMPQGGHLVIRTGQVVLDREAARQRDLDRGGAYALISVVDTGHGMDRETVARIFEPFFTTKETGKGTGLGLSIIYGIVKQHNGTITVESEPGKGATFTVYLPLVEAVVEVAYKEEAPAPAGGAETILLAEDDPMVRKYMQKILEMAGYRLITARNGEEAVELYRENRERIALVVCDVVMPKKNGKEVYDEIRAMEPRARVLFVSGYNDEIIHTKGILLEEIEYLTKPVDRHKLLAKLREMLDA